MEEKKAAQDVRLDASVIGKALPKLGRYLQRVAMNPERYAKGRLLPYLQDAKKLSDITEISEDDWSVLVLIATAFFAIGFEWGGRRKSKVKRRR